MIATTVGCVDRVGRLTQSVRDRGRAAIGRRRAARFTSTTGRALTPLLVQPMEGRTGSTLLMNLLATSPEIVFDRIYPFENRYLTYLSRLVTPSGERFDPATGWNIGELLEGPADRTGPIPFVPLSLDIGDFRRRLTRRSWEAFSEAVEAFSGRSATYYAEKTWGNNGDLLSDAGIAFKVINLVRDPRDVVVSIRAFDAKRNTFGFGRVPGMTDEDFLSHLVDVMATSLNLMDSWDRRFECLLVRYEDLVCDLGPTAQRIGAFLGLDLDVSRPAVLEGHLEQHATSSSPAASIGRFRDELSAADTKVIEGALGAEMARLGYELDGT
jgi:hypothetical protein